jgi:cell division septation protein DedD
MTALGLSDPAEDRSARPPVHYQISVTGRQAGFFFLLLLAALALAFFFGMKTGAAARKGPGAAATLAGASDLPVPTLAPSDVPVETRKAGTAAEKAAEETLGFAADKRAALKEAAGSPPTPAPAATAVPTPHPAVPTAAPAAIRQDAEKSAAKVPEKAATKAPTKGPAGPFFVQVLATKKAPAADELMKRLKGEGFAADISPVPGKDGWFRVRVGPFKERAKAEATAKKIKATDKQIRNTPLVVP